MGRVVETVVSALEPYVGKMVADTCVRATALSIGKTADDLDATDMQAIESNVRRLLGPVAPVSVIESVLAEIKEVAA